MNILYEHACRDFDYRKQSVILDGGRFGVLGVALLLCGCQTARKNVSFPKHELVTGFSERQTILTGFFLGDGAIADLGFANVDDQGQRQPRIYATAGSPNFSVTLRSNVLIVDVANIGGRDRLITYERGRLNWFDPKSRTERSLAKVTSNFQSPRRDEIPHVDVTRDVNGDGLNNLLVPCSDGFRVFVQTSSGGFASPVTIVPAFDKRDVVLTEGYRYDPWRQGRIHAADFNRDGSNDLVYWNNDRFEVHLQNRNGRFASAAKTFTSRVAFDSDDLSTLAAPQGVRHRRKDYQPEGAITGRVMRALTDLNGDGIADLRGIRAEGREPMEDARQLRSVPWRGNK